MENIIEQELWKDIPLFYGYQISSLGNLRSFRGGNSRAKKGLLDIPHPIKPGRYTARGNRPERYKCFSRNVPNNIGGVVKKTISIHKAVMLCFVGPVPDGCEILHGDGDIDNNRLDNLSYGTHTQNMADKKRHGTELVGSKSHSAKLTESIVLEIRNRYALGGVTQASLAKKYNVGHTTISELLIGNKWANVAMVAPEIQPLDDGVWNGTDDPKEFSNYGREVWIDLPWLGYQVSNMGNVRSRWVKGVHPRAIGPRWWNMKITQTKDRAGNITVTSVRICPIDGVPFSRRIAPLVTEAFWGPTPRDKQVAQLNGNHGDNRLCNLAFQSRNEIMQSASLRGALAVGRKLIDNQVLEIRRRKNAGELQYKLAEEFGVSKQLVSNIIQRKIWKHI